MEIVEFTTYNEKSPVTGFGIWIILERGRRTRLFHPVTLTELVVTEYEFRQGLGKTIWPTNTSGCSFNASKFIEIFKTRIAFFFENRRPFPIHVVATALAGFEEISHEEAMKIISFLAVDEDGEQINHSSSKATRVYRLKPGVKIDNFRGRPLALLTQFKETGPASIEHITSKVEGKLKTKSDLSRVVTYFVNKLTSQGILEIVA